MAFCENCGREMSDEAVACPNCGHPRQGAGTIGMAAASTAQPYAEWWKRLVAVLIDGIIVGIPSNIVASMFGMRQGQTGAIDPVTGQIRDASVFAAFGGLMLVLAVASFLYYALLNGSDRGQTLGKMVMKIQVRDKETGGPIGYGRGAIRTLIPGVIGPFTCFILNLIDGLWPLWDPNRQALHDKMANSVVVDANR